MSNSDFKSSWRFVAAFLIYKVAPLTRNRVLTPDVEYSVHKGQNSRDDNLCKSDNVQVVIYLKLPNRILLFSYSLQRVS